jgi:four helix bundle protein
MLKPHSDPYGFKKLLVYSKADELQTACAEFTREFPKEKTLIDLADQMNRSARSGKQNIVEGWKRNSTKEYFDFLGFSTGAIAELEEDCDDIIKGKYMGLRGLKGIMGERSATPSHSVPHSSPLSSPLSSTPSTAPNFGPSSNHSPNSPPLNFHLPSLSPLSSTPSSSSYFSSFSPHSSPSTPSFIPLFPLSRVEKTPFYPLDPALPKIIQLKLRSKELLFLLRKLQDSLELKMKSEGSIPLKDRIRAEENRNKKADSWLKNSLKENGQVRLKSGKVVKKDEIPEGEEIWPDSQW